MHEEAAKHAAEAAAATGLRGSPHDAKKDPFKLRQLTLEAQRDFLVRKGFSQNHPLVTGEVSIHPELQGRLPFQSAGPANRWECSFFEYLKVKGCERKFSLLLFSLSLTLSFFLFLFDAHSPPCYLSL